MKVHYTDVRGSINDPEHPLLSSIFNYSVCMGLFCLGEYPYQDTYQEVLDSYLED